MALVDKLKSFISEIGNARVSIADIDARLDALAHSRAVAERAAARDPALGDGPNRLDDIRHGASLSSLNLQENRGRSRRFAAVWRMLKR